MSSLYTKGIFGNLCPKKSSLGRPASTQYIRDGSQLLEESSPKCGGFFPRRAVSVPQRGFFKAPLEHKWWPFFVRSVGSPLMGEGYHPYWSPFPMLRKNSLPLGQTSKNRPVPIRNPLS